MRVSENFGLGEILVRFERVPRETSHHEKSRCILIFYRTGKITREILGDFREILVRNT